MTSCPTLTTDRLVLRPFRSEDHEPLFAAMTTPEVRASLHVPDDYLARRRLAVADAVRRPVGGGGPGPVGTRGAGPRAGSSAGPASTGDPRRTGPASRWAGCSTRRTGVRATPPRPAPGAVRYGFEELGEDTLFSCILPTNTRSQAVARRLGYRPGEERTMSFFPSAAPRAVATRPAPRWEAVNAG